MRSFVLFAVCLVACGSSSSGTEPATSPSASGGSDAGGASGATSAGGSTSNGGTGGSTSNGGTGGSTAAGAGGTSDAGSGGQSTAGAAGTSSAGAGGTSGGASGSGGSGGSVPCTQTWSGAETGASTCVNSLCGAMGMNEIIDASSGDVIFRPVSATGFETKTYGIADLAGNSTFDAHLTKTYVAFAGAKALPGQAFTMTITSIDYPVAMAGGPPTPCNVGTPHGNADLTLVEYDLATQTVGTGTLTVHVDF